MSDGVDRNAFDHVFSAPDQAQRNLELSSRIWRFSGFATDGNVIEYEFAGPTGQTDTLAFKPSILIGRDRDRCDFVVSDQTVSRVHAMLRYEIGEGVRVVDMGSANGTFVDGDRVGSEAKLLKLNSKLRLGGVQLNVSYRR